MALSNKTLFSWHHWLGIHLGYLLTVICLSGTLAVLSYEFDWLIDPDTRPPSSELAPLPLDQLYERVREQYPDAAITNLSLSRQEYMPAIAGIRHPEWGNLQAYLDPTNGNVLTLRDRVSLKTFFRIFHKQFFLIDSPYSFHGTYIIGPFGIALLISVITGAILLGGWLKKLFRLRRHKGLRLFLADWHRSTGLWALIFTTIFAVTGIWYLLEKFVPPPGAAMFGQVDLQRAQFGDTLPDFDISRYLGAAREQIPNLQVHGLLLPGSPDGRVYLFGSDGAVLVRDSATAVSVNPYNAEVLSYREATKMGLYERWTHTADPLHFGNFAGLGTKIIWFIFGLLITLAIPVGLAMWLLRNRKPIPIRPLATSHLLALLVLLASTAASIAGMRILLGAQLNFDTRLELGTHTVGPWKVSVTAPFNRESLSGQLQLAFDQSRANLSGGEMLRDGEEPQTLRLTWPRPHFSWRARLDVAGLPLPAVIQRTLGDELTIQLTAATGEQHTLTLPPLSAETIAARITPLSPNEFTHRPTQVAIASFLLFMWLGFFAWVWVIQRAAQGQKMRKTTRVPTPPTQPTAG